MLFEKPAQIDRELKGWLERAYELSSQARARVFLAVRFFRTTRFLRTGLFLLARFFLPPTRSGSDAEPVSRFHSS